MTKGELIQFMEGLSDDTRVVIGNQPNEIMEYCLCANIEDIIIYKSDIANVIIYKPSKKHPSGLIVIEHGL